MSLLFSIASLLQQARAKDREDHKAGESQKLGTLRAGTSGILSEQGDIAGQCHRKAHLRSLGIEADPPTSDRLIMFELGFANETVILEQLKSVLPGGHVILCEEEIPIEWQTSNGMKVTGRPDLVICRVEQIPDGPDMTITGISTRTPVLGIELKSVHSMWTVRDVLFGRQPKLDHLVQAAHYMWKLGVPYRLIYKSYSQLGQGMAGGKDGWVQKQFPRAGEPMSQYIEYNDKGGIKHFRQFEIVYSLRLHKGRVQYQLENEGDKWTNTIITTADIERYFEFVSRMAEKQELGPRPLTLDAAGEKANYSTCNYCPLQNVCDSADKSKWTYSKWLDEVKKETDEI